MKNNLMLIGVLVVILAGISLVGSYQKTRVPGDGGSVQQSTLTEIQARMIAAATCVKGGETLGPATYNENSKTWWFDANLNATRSGCNPACVVSEETKTAEINWRCTGAVVPPSDTPDTGMTQCSPESRKGDMCPAIYGPVCATVNVQCIKAPCPPVQQTFPAPCEACHNPLVSGYVSGECPVAPGTSAK